MQILYGEEFRDYCAGSDIVVDGKLGIVLFRVWRFIGVRWIGFGELIAW